MLAVCLSTELSIYLSVSGVITHTQSRAGSACPPPPRLDFPPRARPEMPDLLTLSLGADKENDGRPSRDGRATPLFSFAAAFVAIINLACSAPTTAGVSYESVFGCAPLTCLSPVAPRAGMQVRGWCCIHQPEHAQHTAAASRPRRRTNERCGPTLALTLTLTLTLTRASWHAGPA